MLPRSVKFGAISSFVKPVETENVRYFWFGTGKRRMSLFKVDLHA